MRPSSLVCFLEAVEDSGRRPLAPADACNAVCNEKSKQRTAVRHDRNVFPLEGAPCKKKSRKKKRIRRNVDAEMCPEGALIWAKAED